MKNFDLTNTSMYEYKQFLLSHNVKLLELRERNFNDLLRCITEEETNEVNRTIVDIDIELEKVRKDLVCTESKMQLINEVEIN